MNIKLREIIWEITVLYGVNQPPNVVVYGAFGTKITTFTKTGESTDHCDEDGDNI